MLTNVSVYSQVDWALTHVRMYICHRLSVRCAQLSSTASSYDLGLSYTSTQEGHPEPTIQNELLHLKAVPRLLFCLFREGISGLEKEEEGILKILVHFLSLSKLSEAVPRGQRGLGQTVRAEWK